jgi:transcriptional regulator with XRE-family HTH domain
MLSEINEQSNAELIRQLGQRFREYRLRYNKTQKEIAEQTGLSIPTISSFENGSSTSLSLNAFIRMLRAIEELEELGKLLPEIPLSPYLLLKQQRKQRQRASGNGK